MGFLFTSFSFTILSFFLLSSSFLSSCAHKSSYNENTAKEAFKWAKRLEKTGRYEESLIQYNNLRKKFPYSSYATEASLAIADVQYKKWKYAEAQRLYELFYKMHPTYPKRDYILFRIGMSIYKQFPSTYDRDLSFGSSSYFLF